MENEKTFKTKTGFCHVLSDKIVLTRDGIIGNISKAVVGNGIAKILIIYSGIVIFMLYQAFTSFQNKENGSALLFGALSIFLVYSISKSINNSATPIIERNKIKDAKFINGKTGLTRSRFEIMFEDESGKLKKRLIMLPGSLSDGSNETEKALAIMKSERIISA
ncbi:phosphoribosylaminoimidazolesuccinocarboxamide synthase [Flavobacterium daemonense]|uniref:phosphoribosylaminoimidazolesuccinocarboxamide synthase n=1 Tax=Flavobacterium daemonense TaxID=1393049 RepID=UPI001184C761|nr:phosphoribosylaminoimidazolesuccinocarboxamide synthase [Flavobacterium daemonense]KAF2336398.1 phosphoribosylaminoimidazolesuccinocarboxamide synthase [Flavobacterium daemonense]